MDSSLTPVPEAFLRHLAPDGTDGHSRAFSDDGGPPLADSLLGPGAATSTAAAEGGGGSGWGLRGITQMRWSLWRRDYDTSGPDDASAGGGGEGGDSGVGPVPSAMERRPAAHGEGSRSSGKAWNPYEPGGAAPNLGATSSASRLERPVGPFGNGTGAAAGVRRRVPGSSGLFGDPDEERNAVGTSEGTTRMARLGSGRRPNSRGLGSKEGDWMPDLTIGAAGRRRETSSAEGADGRSSIIFPTDTPMGSVVLAPVPAHTTAATSSGMTMSWPPERDETTAQGSKSSLAAFEAAGGGEGSSKNGVMKTPSWVTTGAEIHGATGSSSAFGAGMTSGKFVDVDRNSSLAKGSRSGEFAVLEAQEVEGESSEEEEDNPFA